MSRAAASRAIARRGANVIRQRAYVATRAGEVHLRIKIICRKSSTPARALAASCIHARLGQAIAATMAIVEISEKLSRIEAI